MKSAICLIVKNEERNIAEWMAFHSVVGFDAQIIFDNCSDDKTAEIVRAAREVIDIRYHYWRDQSGDSQTLSYEAACAAYKLEFDWIAFVDSDEFIVPEGSDTINDFLLQFDRWSGVAVNWAIFGSNGHQDFPTGLVIEDFTRRAGADFAPTRHVKSIIRPGFAARCINPHCFDLAGHIDGSYCDPAGRAVEWLPTLDLSAIIPGLTLNPPNYENCRINHYFTRSFAHWTAKLRRGYPDDILIRKKEEFSEYDRNEIEDKCALRYSAAVHAMVAKLVSMRTQNKVKVELPSHPRSCSNHESAVVPPLELASGESVGPLLNAGDCNRPAGVEQDGADRLSREVKFRAVKVLSGQIAGAQIDALATDGHIGTGFLGEDEEVWLLDLHTEFKIDEIIISQFLDLPVTPTRLTISAAEDERAWRLLFAYRGKTGSDIFEGNRLRVSFFVPPRARFIRFTTPSTSPILVEAVQIYGKALV